MSTSKSMYALVFAGVSVGAHAQGMPGSPARDGAAAPPATQRVAPAAAPEAGYRSALHGFRQYADEPVSPWREANDTVRRIGGWQAYGRESYNALRAAPPAAAAPAAAPAPANPPAGGDHHRHHGAPK